MAFQQKKLERSVNQTRGIFDKFIYSPENNDLIDDVLSLGYFNQSRFVNDKDWVGSVIEISASDGYAIARIVDGGVVTLYKSTGQGAVNVDWGDITGDLANQVDLNNELETINQRITDIDALNVKVVNSIDDFPRPVGDVITLESGTIYQIGNTIATSNRFVAENGVVLTTNNPLATALVYTGTGTMFTTVDANFAIDFATVSCPSGQLFDCSSTTPNQFTTGLNIVTVVQCNSIGTFDGLSSINITNTRITTNQGLTLLGSEPMDTITFSRFRIVTTNPALIGINLGNVVIQSLDLLAYILDGVTGSVGISGLANSGNIQAGSLGDITQSEFLGGSTALVGITSSDIRYSFFGNAGIKDSIVAANPYLTAQTNVTVTTSGTYYKVNNNNWNSTVEERVAVSDDGDVTNALESPVTVQISGFVTVEKQGGGADAIAARIVLNDNPLLVESSITTNSTENSQPTSIPLTGIFELQSGDSLSLYVANEDGTSNIIVYNSKFTMLRVL